MVYYSSWLAYPPTGFDRLTANRTNYSLGQHPASLTTSTAELQTKHPREQPRVQQPAIGGSTLRDGSYRLDAVAKDSIRRGGGGGEGVLGVRFDIVNAREKNGARGEAGLRTGPRRSLDCAEKRSLHPTDGWGDVPGGTAVDILTGSDTKLPKAPERGTGVLVRSDTVIGRTRPW